MCTAIVENDGHNRNYQNVRWPITSPPKAPLLQSISTHFSKTNCGINHWQSFGLKKKKITSLFFFCIIEWLLQCKNQTFILIQRCSHHEILCLSCLACCPSTSLSKLFTATCPHRGQFRPSAWMVPTVACCSPSVFKRKPHQSRSGEGSTKSCFREVTNKTGGFWKNCSKFHLV